MIKPRKIDRFVRLGAFLWLAPQMMALGELRAMSDSDAATKESSGIWRFEAETEQKFAVPPGATLQPGRVYVVYNKDLEKKVFTITTPKGKLPQPPEGLAPGTVLPGSAIGASKGSNYLLTAAAKWVPTKNPVQRRYWTLTQFPEFRLAVPFTENQ